MMKRWGLSLFLGAMSMSLMACGESEMKGKEPTLIYNFVDEEAPCRTGRQEFNSIDSFCMSLPNDSKNNECAFDQRSDEFLSECGSQEEWDDLYQRLNFSKNLVEEN